MALDHKDVCNGNLRCSKCGRRICQNCAVVNINGEFKNYNELEYVLHFNIKLDKLECLICTGIYKEKDINLWPAEDKDWDI